MRYVVRNKHVLLLLLISQLGQSGWVHSFNAVFISEPMELKNVLRTLVISVESVYVSFLY